MRSVEKALPVRALAQLRAATAALHGQLDATLPLAQPGATLPDYALHLRVLRQWLRHVQPALSSVAPAVAAATREPDPPRLRWIEDDLLACPAALRGDATDRLPLRAAPADAASCWGLAYVVEGSALGGQALLRRLAPGLAPHPLRYLQGQGAATGMRWRAFLAALEAALDGPEPVARASAAAAGAFEDLIRLYAHEVRP